MVQRSRVWPLPPELRTFNNINKAKKTEERVLDEKKILIRKIC